MAARKPLRRNELRGEAVAVLEDGDYEALVVDAGDGGDDPAGALVELAIVAGPHKGEVVAVRASELRRDPVDLLGLPATLTVAGGRPHVRLHG